MKDLPLISYQYVKDGKETTKIISKFFSPVRNGKELVINDNLYEVETFVSSYDSLDRKTDLCNIHQLQEDHMIPDLDYVTLLNPLENELYVLEEKAWFSTGITFDSGDEIWLAWDKENSWITFATEEAYLRAKKEEDYEQQARKEQEEQERNFDRIVLLGKEGPETVITVPALPEEAMKAIKFDGRGMVVLPREDEEPKVYIDRVYNPYHLNDYTRYNYTVIHDGLTYTGWIASNGKRFELQALKEHILDNWNKTQKK